METDIGKTSQVTWMVNSPITGKVNQMTCDITPIVDEQSFSTELTLHQRFEFSQLALDGWKALSIEVKICPSGLKNSDGTMKVGKGGSIAKANVEEYVGVMIEDFSETSQKTGFWNYTFHDDKTAQSSYECQQRISFQFQQPFKLFTLWFKLRFQGPNGRILENEQDFRFSPKIPLQTGEESKCSVIVIGPRKSAWNNLLYASFGGFDNPADERTTRLTVYDFLNVPDIFIKGRFKVMDTAGQKFNLDLDRDARLIDALFEGLPTGTILSDESWKLVTIDPQNKPNHAIIVVAAHKLLKTPSYLYSWFYRKIPNVELIDSIVRLFNYTSKFIPQERSPYLVLTHRDMVTPKEYDELCGMFMKRCENIGHHYFIRIGKTCNMNSIPCQNYACDHEFTDESLKNVKQVVSTIFAVNGNVN